MKNYSIEKTTEGIELKRENIEGLKLVSQEGLCKADSEIYPQLRSIQWYDEYVLSPAIERGELDDGSKTPFDDRKMRYHSSSIKMDTLQLDFGHSNFLEFKEQFDKTPEEYEKLKRKGRELFDEEYAFFSRAPGVGAVILTSDGSTILGEREIKGQKDDYWGSLHGAAGHLDFRLDPRRVNLEEDLERELEEEMGISLENITSKIFVGLFSNPLVGNSDLEFGYIIKTNLPAIHFTSGAYKINTKDNEHRRLIEIPSYTQIKQLLGNGILPGHKKRFDIIFSTRGILDCIRSEEMLN